jgi:hypothetical protein
MSKDKVIDLIIVGVMGVVSIGVSIDAIRTKHRISYEQGYLDATEKFHKELEEIVGELKEES